MSLKCFTLLIGLMFNICVSAQETMLLKDGKQLPATATWDFISENYALTGNAKIQIAKAAKNGILKLSAETTDLNFFIGGTVYVYLSDYSVITCTDKNIRDRKENNSIAYYSFTPSEMNILKKTDIQSIRFNIRGNPQQFSSQIGNFTAVNKKSFFSGFGKEEKNIFETAEEIALLYK